MATWIVSGGGTALDDALNRRNGYNYTNGDTILVKPGIYSRVNFAQYYQNISVIGEEGKENTIVDAGGISGGSIVSDPDMICNPCLLNRYTNSTYIYNIYGLSLRNGFISTDLSTDALIANKLKAYRAAGATGALRLYDCGIYDCSCYSLFNTGSANIGNNRINAVSRINGNLTRCEISGIHGNTIMIHSGGSSAVILNYCDIHDNYWEHSNNGDHPMFFSYMYRSRFHHNHLSGIGFDAVNIFDSLIYRNQGTGSTWLTERCNVANCVFAYNTGIHSFENAWGGRSAYKNNVFYQNFKSGTTRAGAIWYTQNSGTVHVNNYFDQLSTTMSYNTPMTSAYVSGNYWVNNADFGFVDPENDDYRIKLDSILTAAGSTFLMGADNEYETNSNYRSRLSSLDTNLATGDIERKPWDPEHPSVGAFQYYPPAQNLPNRTYPLGREREHSGMIYDAELTYLSGPGFACFGLPIDIDYRTSFEIKSTCGYLSTDAGVYQNRWGVDATIDGKRYRYGLYNGEYDQLYLGGYSTVPGSGYFTYKGNTIYTYSFDAENLSGSVAKGSNAPVNFTVSLQSGYPTDWSIPNWNYCFFGGAYSANKIPQPQIYSKAPSRFYYAKFWNSDGMIADIIPVRVGNAGYLFDKVKGKMLIKYPIGTNIQFRKGPDK